MNRNRELRKHFYELVDAFERGGYVQIEAETRAFSDMSDDPLAFGLGGADLTTILGVF